MAAPSKGEDAKRRIITMRVTNAMYDRIASATEASGRSVSQEIESRLELSFQEERIVGGSDTTLLTKLIAGAVALTEIETERKWTEDRMTWEAVNAAVRRIVSWFQPELDHDIWKKNDETFFHFMDAVYALQDKLNVMDGLAKAYIPGRMPPDINERYHKAADEYPEALAEVRRRAKGVFEGPMREQGERTREAVKLGRQIAGERQGKRSGSFIVAGVARMYKRSGAFEPLPGLREAESVTDEELFDAVRLLAGAPAEDPDMELFRIKPRTLEDHINGDDQEA